MTEYPLIASIAQHYIASHDLSRGRIYDITLCVRNFQCWAGVQCSIDSLRDGVNEYIEHEIARGEYAKNTLAKYGRIYRGLLRYADEVMGLDLGRYKVKVLKELPPMPHCFTLDELQALDKQGTQIQKAAIRLVYDTGLRRSNAFRAKWSQMTYLPEPVLVVRQVKSQLPIPCRLRRETMAALRAIFDGDLLLPEPLSGNWDDRWTALGKRAGVDTKGRGLHAIRKSGASYSERDGHSASHYLGHADPDSVKHYLDPRIAYKPAELPPTFHDPVLAVYREETA